MGVIELSSWVLQGVVFFFNDTATTEIYTLSLHDALPISAIADIAAELNPKTAGQDKGEPGNISAEVAEPEARSEEHTSELQSH